MRESDSVLSCQVSARSIVLALLEAAEVRISKLIEVYLLVMAL